MGVTKPERSQYVVAILLSMGWGSNSLRTERLRCSVDEYREVFRLPFFIVSSVTVNLNLQSACISIGYAII